MAEVGAAGDQGQVKQEVDELTKQVDEIAIEEVFSFVFNFYNEKHRKRKKNRVDRKSKYYHVE